MESREAIIALAALAQETRLAIFRLLVQAGADGMPAGAIATTLGVAPATLSFHLKELTRARLITPRAAARFIYYSADYQAMAALVNYLTENCCQGKPGECIEPKETALSRLVSIL